MNLSGNMDMFAVLVSFIMTFEFIGMYSRYLMAEYIIDTINDASIHNMDMRIRDNEIELINWRFEFYRE
jgi:hypothetical protein